MFPWPRSVHAFGASLQAAATEWRLRRRDGAAAAQERTRRELMRTLSGATVWSAAGLEPGLTYPQFRERIAPGDHARIAPIVARMQAGEGNLLHPGRTALFVQSAGTSSGPRPYPVNDPMLAHFRTAWHQALLTYIVRVRHGGVLSGRQLHCAGNPRLDPLGTDGQRYQTTLAGMLDAAQPASHERHFQESGPIGAATEEWNARLEALAYRTAGRDITLLAGLPSTLVALVETVQRLGLAGPGGEISARWPNLECCLHRGAALEPYQARLEAALGPTVVFHEVYVAPEGLIAVQDGPAYQGLRVAADAGLFLEFIPFEDYDEKRLEQIGARAVPLEGVRTGVDYAVLATTPAGLVRHALGDVVRFTSVRPHRLLVAGRTGLRLNTVAEGVGEREIGETLASVCRSRDWHVTHVHVAPVAPALPSLTARSRHEWWVELKPGTVATPTGTQLAVDLDLELTRRNQDYAARRRAGTLEPPLVRLVIPGVFEHWLTFRRAFGDEHKVPLCRGDRLIADELAQVTNFASG